MSQVREKFSPPRLLLRSVCRETIDSLCECEFVRADVAVDRGAVGTEALSFHFVCKVVGRQALRGPSSFHHRTDSRVP